MKLLRYGNPGQEKPGMLDQNGTIRDLSNIVEDIAGDVLLPEGLEKLKNLGTCASATTLLWESSGQLGMSPMLFRDRKHEST